MIKDRFKPPAPVYRPCDLCGKKHRMRPNGSSKTAEILAEDKVVIKDIGQNIRLPAGALICLWCGKRPSKRWLRQ